MTTVVVAADGSGDYTTLQAAIDACPNKNLVSAGDSWICKVKGTLTVSTGKLLYIPSGTFTTDSSHFVEVSAASGQGFLDNANIRNVALNLSAYTGAKLEHTGNGPILDIRCNYSRIVGLLLSATSSGNTSAGVDFTSGSPTVGHLVDKCLIDVNTTQYKGGLAFYGAGGSTVSDSLVVQRKANVSAAYLGSGSKAYNCTFLNLGGNTAGVIRGDDGSAYLYNCYVGGASLPIKSGSTTIYYMDKCYTDASGPPANWYPAALSSATFVSATNDFRVAVGSALIRAGTYNVNSGPTDISKFAWTNPPDVGCWQSGTDTSSVALGITTTDALVISAASVSPLVYVAANVGGATTSIGATSGASLASVGITTSTETISITVKSAALANIGGQTQGSTSSIGVAALLPSAAISLTASNAIGAVVSVGNLSIASITTPPLKNNAGTLLSDQTGVVVYVYSVSTGALILTVPGATTDGGGVLTLTSGLLSAGATYRLVIVLGSGAEGMSRVVAS